MENKSHIQVLLKDNIVIAELVFEDTDPVVMAETFEQFDYDQIIDTRRKEVSPTGLGSGWNGKKFIPKPYLSWTFSENLTWEAPIPSPSDEKKYRWNEAAQEWAVCDFCDDCN
jgi:hypothetical protein